MLQLAMISH